uniref:Toll like receptor 1 n=1 Tax=Rhinopithecus bieti TaxID=61621 RepID=A0A2K6LFC0_RHIBE
MTSIFHFAIIFMLTLQIRLQLSEESEFLVDRSKNSLIHVPKDLSQKTTILNISQNYISELWTSDILSLSKLRILIISHNRLQHLDISVFKFNQELEYLDLSHNKLAKISCHPTVNLKHLDLSFNAFDALPICKEFGNMSLLKFLGLSTTHLEKSTVLPIAHLNISKVLLVLGEHYGDKEDPEGLQNFNTESLHIVFPTSKEFNFILDVSVRTVANLELSNIKCVLEDNECSYFLNILAKLQTNPKLSSLTLNNIETTWNSFIRILQLVWNTTVWYFSISNVKLQGQLDFRDFDYSGTSLKALSIHQVVSDVFNFPQRDIYEIFSNMNIKNFTVSGTHMIHMLCPSKISPFLHLDFSNNLLTDTVFENCGHLTELETLILQMNQLKELSKIAEMTTRMKSLQKLDISQNSVSYDEKKGDCSWTKSLLSLNICLLLQGCKVLDLHSNKIQEHSLNRATTFLDVALGAFPVLIIDHNSVSPPMQLISSRKLPEDEVKKAGTISIPVYPVSLREFVRNIEQCDYPESYRGTPLKDGPRPGGRRARNVPLEELQRNLQFHAFISYSGHDSFWVKNELLPNLEKEGMQICLHERNFVPGKSIVENIINCIEKSYKSIFVLSPNFVQSEWCHYELYFAHHNLFHEGYNNLILILLEPIPQYSIPSSYHKLKNLMARRTYLAWPKEKSKHGLFWANLRAAINIKLTEQAKK